MNISNAGRKPVPKHRLRSATIAALAAVCGTALADVAATAPPGEALTHTVSYADLDLGGQVGAATLLQRLRAAAGTVCRPFEGRALSDIVRHRSCVEQAIARAVTEVDAPMLTALHRGEGGTPASPVRLARRK